MSTKDELKLTNEPAPQPATESIYLSDPPWFEAGRHLRRIEDEVHRAYHLKQFKAIEAFQWIAKNVKPLEKRYAEGDRSPGLLFDIMSLRL